jgi:hypothetical protein
MPRDRKRDRAFLTTYPIDSTRRTISSTIATLERTSALLDRAGPMVATGLSAELVQVCLRVDAACDLAQRLAGLEHDAEATAQGTEDTDEEAVAAPTG